MTRLDKFGLLGALVVLVVAGAAMWVHSNRPGRHYTCADILGEHPEPGYLAILPPHWSFTSGISISRDGTVEQAHDFRVWDERGRLVCDENGKDVSKSSVVSRQ